MLFVSLVVGSLSQSISQLGLSKQRGGEIICKTQERLVLHLSRICGTNSIILSMWPNHLPCTPVILWQWHWIWTRSCKAEKTQLIQARETQNTEEIHQIYTKQGEERHWALPLVSYPMRSALTQVLSMFRYLKGMTELPNGFLFRPLAAKMKRCTVLFCLSLPCFLARKDLKEIGLYLERNVLLGMWNGHREQTTIPLKKGTFYRSADSGISKDKGVQGKNWINFFVVQVQIEELNGAF